MKHTRKKLILFAAKGLAVLTFALPLGVYAAGPAPATSAPTTLPTTGTDIIVEYRYTEGEEGNVNIPDTIARYGRNYRLTEKKPAILESTMPATRTYSWKIDGFITEEQAAKIVEEYPGLVLTPAYRDGSESVDITRTVVDVPINDVELIPYTISHNESELRRAAVQFEISKDESGAPLYDTFGLPLSYTAEVIYRGLAAVQVPGYYSVTETYESKEALGDVAQYVIITTYSPIAVPSSTTSAATTGTGSTGSPTDTEAGSQNPIPIGSLVDDPVSEEEASVEAAIVDDPVPQTDGETGISAKAILFTILKVLLIVIAAFAGFIGALVLRKKIIKARRRLRKRAVYQ